MIRCTILFGYLLASITGIAQVTFPELSPPGTIEQRIGFTSFRIEYERPAVRGRKIFGGLVPFGKVWRTGAGPCTKIRFNTAVLLNADTIPAGTYSIFSIPGLKEWTIILNKDTTLYGAFDYDPAKDVIRCKTKPTSATRYFESLTFDIDVVRHDLKMYISWENTQVHILIKTFTDELTMTAITRDLLSGISDDWNEYADAADYYLNNQKNLDEALILANRALAKNGELYGYVVKMQVLERQKKYSEAVLVGQDGIKFIRERGKALGYDVTSEVKLMDTRISELRENKNKEKTIEERNS